MNEKQLIKIVGSDRYFDDPETIAAYSQDHSFTPPRTPLAVVKPKNTEQIQGIINVANTANLSLVPVSSGTPRFNGDTIPACPGVVVDLSGLDKVVRVDRRNLVAMIEPGVTFGQLREALDPEGMAPYTPLIPRSTKSVLAAALEKEPITIPKDHWDVLDPIAGGQVIIGDGHLQGFGDTAQFTQKEVADGVTTPVYPVGPSNIGWLNMIQGSQGTLGIVPWGLIRCRMKPSLEKPFFISASDVNDLLPFLQKIMRPRIVEELFIVNASGLATLLSEDSEEIKKLQATFPEWVLFFNIAGYNRYPEEDVAWKGEQIREIADQEGAIIKEVVGEVSASYFLKTLAKTATIDRKIRYKDSCAVLPFETTLDKIPAITGAAATTAAERGYPSSDLSIYIQPVIQGSQCQGEIIFPYRQKDDVEKEKVKNLFSYAAEKLRSLGAYYSRPYGILAKITYKEAGIAKICRTVKGILDPNDVMHSGKLF